MKSFTQRSPIDKAFDTRAVLDGSCHAQSFSAQLKSLLNPSAMNKFLAVSVLLLASAVNAHAAPAESVGRLKVQKGQSSTPSTEPTLQGKWTHESDGEQGRLKQITQLQSQQKFTQHATYTGPNGEVVANNTATGKWSIEGDRFVRIFTAFNGQKLKPRDYVSFNQKILSVSPNEFVTEKSETGEKVVFTRSR